MHKQLITRLPCIGLCGFCIYYPMDRCNFSWPYIFPWKKNYGIARIGIILFRCHLYIDIVHPSEQIGEQIGYRKENGEVVLYDK